MAEDTVIGLVNAAKKLDEAVGWVTAAFARRLTSEHLLRRRVPREVAVSSNRA